MGRKKMHCPELEVYLAANYKKEFYADIAEKFKVSPSYVSKVALQMGLSRPKEAVKAVNGIPAGYTKKDIVSVNALGMVLQKGVVRRHTLRG